MIWFCFIWNMIVYHVYFFIFICKEFIKRILQWVNFGTWKMESQRAMRWGHISIFLSQIIFSNLSVSHWTTLPIKACGHTVKDLQGSSIKTNSPTHVPPIFFPLTPWLKYICICKNYHLHLLIWLLNHII